MLRIDVLGRLEYSKWTDFAFYASSVLMNELEFNEYLHSSYSNNSFLLISEYFKFGKILTTYVYNIHLQELEMKKLFI